MNEIKCFEHEVIFEGHSYEFDEKVIDTYEDYKGNIIVICDSATYVLEKK